ncbi:2-keto-4-pentenoate hydratase/2-oxohepta-3-ene-1,7-dioic acid hydratase (catechol pathway) [Tistlia consotensis]|uniref:2-keto-4-pentenoate hydratase/2-oxohepta-3-ene-1,7-dioic acid hydratase (Catechol pathway) n=1 Tax=Tistlia consotensis USBA 355 TaxID=560819 RepID=A0A1Y6CBQ9_9PROT|nr:fumarylacetoacetate hydrolase family protein [Tistlia consotensis]SMF55487.1 2-keto-4-pentenoate hydratase/2-oxohepta-3-ene-1,7-dioic acid hydratase (catechol pathway) [Tistlia consotensis USBA 355]SNR88536.1 2-keto-4-pentenoate hydratase/2-oxohepta-3-ene-1,7-dioic acid hydratase (catechol pathway) [Tistlia consotensis]
MKLVTYEAAGRIRVGLLNAGQVVDLADLLDPAPADMLALLQGGLERLRAVAAEALPEGEPLAAVRLLAPVPRPGKVIGVGRNYGAHAAEGGLEAQEQPRLFTKVPSSVVGPGAAIEKPAAVTRLDWEAELAVVVGRTMRDVPEAEALDFVAGYTLLNDVSAREFQFDVKPPQTSFAKSMDGFCPMGPCLVTADEIPDPGHLQVRCRVNGKVMQDGNTHDMIFPVPTVLSYVSRYLTLEPGDVIATGTPEGVGVFRKPPVYLVPGDRVEVEIPGIGVLENPVVLRGAGA